MSAADEMSAAGPPQGARPRGGTARSADRGGALPRPLVARAARRAHPVRSLSARLPAARGTARRVLRAPARGRRDRAHDVRPVVRLLHRSDREEAAQSFLPGIVRVLVRHGGLQPRVQVLPELGHLEVARDGHADGRRVARSDRRDGCEAWLPQRRLHVQRSGDLCRICDGHRGRLSRARDRDGGGHGRLHRHRGARRVLREDGCRQRRSQRLHRRVLREALRRPLAAGARHARLSEARDRCLVRDHHPADPGQERFERGDRGDVGMDRRASSAPTCRCISRRSIRTTS